MNEASTPSQNLKTDRRTAILAVARETFLERGYGAASMSDIAERLGGSKGTLYNYFRSKEELFRAVVRQHSDQLYEQLQGLSQRAPDLESYLRDFGRRLLSIVLSDDYIAFNRLVISEAGRIPLGANFEGRRQSVLASLARRLGEEMGASRLRRADPLDAAEDFWNLCSATVRRRGLMGAESHPVQGKVDAIVERAVDVFTRAYAT